MINKLFPFFLLWLSIGFTISSQNVVQLPFEEHFESQESFDKFTVIDKNDDFSTWAWSEEEKNAFYFTSLDDLPADDWLITPGMSLVGGSTYVFKLDVKSDGDDTPEKVSIWVGNGQTDESMTQSIMPETVVSSSSYKHLVIPFEVLSDGIYYIGIHCTSDPDMMNLTIDNLVVEEGPKNVAPNGVTDFVVSADKQGALKASISFVTPSTKVDGTAIDRLDSLQILRDDIVVHMMYNLDPHSNQFYQDLQAKQGFNKYTVVAYVGRQRSLEVSESVFVGEDIPSGVSNVTVEFSNHGAQIKWLAPQTGFNGYQINSKTLTYEIYGCYSVAERKLIDRDIDKVTYEDTKTQFNQGDQRQWSYGIYALSKGGKSPIAYSEQYIIGAPYVTPFIESIPNKKLENKMWGLTNDSGKAKVLATSISQDDDGGALLLRSTLANDTLTLTSGKIATKNVENLLASFYFKASEKDSIYFMVAKDNRVLFSQKVHQQPNVSDWQKVSFDLTKFSELDYIQIYFGLKFDKTPSDVCIDNIYVGNKTHEKSFEVLSEEGIILRLNGNLLEVSNPNGKMVRIITMTGSDVVKSSRKEISVALDHGVYLICTENTVKKVII